MTSLTTSRCDLDIWPWHTILIYDLDMRSWYMTLAYDLDLWPWHVTLTCNLDIWPWHVILTNDLDMQSWYMTVICDLDVWHWHATWSRLKSLGALFNFANTSCLNSVLENCTYVGEHVPHAYSWTIDCAENCTCFDGEVTCVTLCQQQTTIANCSNPVRRKSEDGCCDVISCENTGTQVSRV